MTRKDYIAIAKGFSDTKPRNIQNVDSSWVLNQWWHDVRSIANVLGADNPRFDYQRFYDACEGDK